MPVISVCHAPDIASDAPSLVGEMICALTLQGRSPLNTPIGGRLFTAYLSATDKAIREYNAARALLLTYVNSNN
jgi:hypothetical protein